MCNFNANYTCMSFPVHNNMPRPCNAMKKETVKSIQADDAERRASLQDQNRRKLRPMARVLYRKVPRNYLPLLAPHELSTTPVHRIQTTIRHDHIRNLKAYPKLPAKTPKSCLEAAYSESESKVFFSPAPATMHPVLLAKDSDGALPFLPFLPLPLPLSPPFSPLPSPDFLTVNVRPP